MQYPDFLKQGQRDLNAKKDTSFHTQGVFIASKKKYRAIIAVNPNCTRLYNDGDNEASTHRTLGCMMAVAVDASGKCAEVATSMG